MLVIVGYLIVIVSVFGGFAMAGGHIASLFQPVELVMIAVRKLAEVHGRTSRASEMPCAVRVALATAMRCNAI